MRKTQTLTPDYFEGLYAADPDPWKFETSAYEQAKYRATLAALGAERAHQALEVGCANGVLTQGLAHHCDGLLAVDVSPTALAQAKQRCADQRNVSFALLNLPQDTAPGAFDLIVLSEVAYYWDGADCEKMAQAIRRQMLANGRLLLVHWLGETDYPATGDQAVQRLEQAFAGDIQIERADRTADYRLDLWRWGR